MSTYIEVKLLEYVARIENKRVAQSCISSLLKWVNDIGEGCGVKP